MLHPNGNEPLLDLGTHYWRARAEELEKQLAETRSLLMQVVSFLPPEHLGKLKLNLIRAGRVQLDSDQAALQPDSQPRAE